MVHTPPAMRVPPGRGIRAMPWKLTLTRSVGLGEWPPEPNLVMSKLIQDMGERLGVCKKGSAKKWQRWACRGLSSHIKLHGEICVSERWFRQQWKKRMKSSWDWGRKIKNSVTVTGWGEGGEAAGGPMSCPKAEGRTVHGSHAWVNREENTTMRSRFRPNKRIWGKRGRLQRRFTLE